MFCSKCGTKIENNAKFCPSCGNKVEQAENGSSNTEAASSASYTPVTPVTPATPPVPATPAKPSVPVKQNNFDAFDKKMKAKESFRKAVIVLVSIIVIVGVACFAFCSTSFGKRMIATHYSEEGNYEKAYSILENSSDEKSEVKKEFYSMMMDVETIIYGSLKHSDAPVDTGGIGSTKGTNPSGKTPGPLTISTYNKVKIAAEELLPETYYPNSGRYEGRIGSDVARDMSAYRLKNNIHIKGDDLSNFEYEKLCIIKDCIYQVDNSSADAEDFSYWTSKALEMYAEFEELSEGRSYVLGDEYDLFLDYQSYVGNAQSIYSKYDSSTFFEGYYHFSDDINYMLENLEDHLETSSRNSTWHYTSFTYEEPFSQTEMSDSLTLAMAKHYFCLGFGISE